MTVNLNGVFAPVVTTFSPRDGELDIAGFESNVAAHMAAGLHGVVVTGSTGEAALLDAAERGALVDAARQLIPSGKGLIVGTGAESTRTCVQAHARRGCIAARTRCSSWRRTTTAPP